jgi:putative ABC transport system ATP-binding protein
MTPGAPTEPAVRLDGVTFRYADQGFQFAVPSLAIERGERVAIVGPSGSGKTTLLHLITGILAPTAGEVTVVGRKLTSLGDAGRRAFRIRNVGCVFQGFALLPHLTVLENVLLPYLVSSALPLDAAATDRARELADRAGIGDKLGRRPEALSQGERQRVAILRALVTAPALVCADEPTGNLDRRTGDVVLDLIEAHRAAAGSTLILVTHQEHVLDRFDRVIDVTTLAGVTS